MKTIYYEHLGGQDPIFGNGPSFCNRFGIFFIQTRYHQLERLAICLAILCYKQTYSISYSQLVKAFSHELLGNQSIQGDFDIKMICLLKMKTTFIFFYEKDTFSHYINNYHKSKKYIGNFYPFNIRCGCVNFLITFQMQSDFHFVGNWPIVLPNTAL